jgi:hypothetical protein
MAEINGRAAIAARAVVLAGGDVADMAEALGHPMTQAAIVQVEGGRLVYICRVGSQQVVSPLSGSVEAEFESDPAL